MTLHKTSLDPPINDAKIGGQNSGRLTTGKEIFMTADELGKILSTMYEDAPQNDSVAMIHLFGIMHANEIHTCSMREIVAAAGIPASYVSEVAKGVRLAKYVTVK